MTSHGSGLFPCQFASLILFIRQTVENVSEGTGVPDQDIAL